MPSKDRLISENRPRQIIRVPAGRARKGKVKPVFESHVIDSLHTMIHSVKQEYLADTFPIHNLER